jgi:hypothetical protein
MSGKILIPGVNLDVSGDDAADLAKTLRDAKAGDPIPVVPNQVVDTHLSSALGTLTNAQITGQRLELDPSETSGNQELNITTSINVQSVGGQIDLAARALAPKAIPISANTLTFHADLSNVLTAGTKVLFFREFTELSTLRHKYLTNAQNQIAVLEVDSISYDMVNDETEVVISNPQNLDLSLGINTVDFPDELRMSLMTVTVQAKHEAGGTYQNAVITDAVTTGTLRLNEVLGDANYETLISGITGSIIRSGIDVSPSGDYILACVLEVITANAGIYHFFYSKNKGVTWTKTSFTDSDISSGSCFENTLHGYLSNPSVVVSDNGKGFVSYSCYTAALNWHVKGAYIDMTVVTPDMTPSAATGVDAENSVGTAGFIYAGTTNNRVGFVCGDKVDLSFVSFVGLRQDDTIDVRFYTAGGATYQGADLTGYTHNYFIRPSCVVTGSLGSHRTTIAIRNGANITFRYYNEPSNSSAGTFGSTSATLSIFDFKSEGSKAYTLLRNDSTSRPAYLDLTTSGSPTASSLRILTNTVDIDNYFGLSDYENSISAPYNWGNYLGKQVLIDPNNTNRVLFSFESVHPDTIRRATVVEVRDSSSFVGSAISQLASTTWNNLNNDVVQARLGQVITFSATRIRTVSISAFQIGSIAENETVHLEIYNTSAGLPTTLLATSLNTYNASKLTKNTSGQWLHFRFNELNLTGSYAIVLVPSYSVNASNCVGWRVTDANPYSGGTQVKYNSSTLLWSIDSANDHTFEVNGEWIYDVSEGTHSTNKFGISMWDQNTSLSFAASGQAQVVSRRASNESNLYRPISGILHKSTITLGSGTSASSVTRDGFIGYESIDDNLVFATVPGITGYSRKNTITGVVDTALAAEDRSGLVHTTTYTSITSADFVNDSDFLHGRAFQPQTNGSLILYNDSPVFRNLHNRKFVLEQEVKPLNLTDDKILFSQAFATAVNTWWGFSCRINSSNGTVEIQAANGSTWTTVTKTSTGLSAGTYYRIRFVNDGTNVRIYYNLSKSGGTWVEFGYDTFNTISVFGYNTTALFSPFSIYDSNSNISGPQSLVNTGVRYGYAKVIRGSSSVAYDGLGVVGQAPITRTRSVYNKVFGEQGLGTNGTAFGTNFDDFGLINPNAFVTSFANSYQDQLYFKGSLGGRGNNPHLKLQLDRVGDDNDTQVRGFVARFKR